MVLVLFTEPELKQALLTVMKRCAYVLFPVSILWIKYFPELGRKWDRYGSVMNSGVTTGKNAMGNMSAIFGLFFLWCLLQLLRKEKTPSRWREFQLTLGLLLMIAYCLLKAHSATSDICFILGTGIMVAIGLRSLNKRVIAPRARRIQDYFAEEELICFNLGDSEDLADKFDFVFRHPCEVEEIVKRGQRVYQNHTWSGEKANLLSCFAEIA